METQADTFTMPTTKKKNDNPKNFGTIIKIGGKLHATDADMVVMRHNGNRITRARNQIVVIPTTHVSCLAHATKPVFKAASTSDINPNTEYATKDVELMPRFSYQIFGVVDKKNYDQLLKTIIDEKRGLTEQEVRAALSN